jgi:hypothetical protein
MTGDLELGDNVKATFGADDDLQIFHDGSHSQIRDTGTGNLYIKATSGVLIQDNDTGTNRLTTSSSGPVYLYHAGSNKLATSSSGVDITGNIDLADNGKLLLGDGDDLQIYHNGLDSYINDVGTGRLYIRGNDSVRIQSGDSENMAKFNHDGSVQLYHNNVEKLATTSTGIDITGDITATGDEIILDSSTQSFLKLDKGSSSNFALTRYYTAGTEEWRTGTYNDGTSSFYIGAPTGKNLSIATGGDISFYDDTGTTPKFFWDASAERLGIGDMPTTPKDTALVLRSNSDAHAITIYEPVGANENWQLGVDADGDLGFYNSGSATASVTFDDSGNVGIGCSPATKLEVEGDSNADTGTVSAPVAIRITDTNGGGNTTDTTNPYAALQFFSRDTSNEGPIVQAQIGAIYDDVYAAGSHLTFSTWNAGGGSATERMRIDSSGNVLVGTTSAYGTAGTTINAAGLVYSSADGDRAGQFDRTTSDGELVRFSKAGTTVGSIGSAGGASDLYVSSNTFGVRLLDSDTALIPATSNGSTGFTTADLGTSSYQWKDLYLSGTAQIQSGDRGTGGKGGALIVGADSGSSSITTNTRKIGLITCPSYDNTDGNMALITGDASSASTNYIYIGSAYTGYTSPTDIVFNTGSVGTQGSEAMRIDASGNLGLGVTPESWHSNVTALQIGDLGAVWVYDDGSNPEQTHISENVYNNGEERYIESDYASTHQQRSGVHTFKVAPSGTADSAISWTTAMTIDNSANVLVGCTALPSYGNGGAGFETGQSSGRSILQLGTTTTSPETVQRFYNPNGSTGGISLSGSSTSYNTSSDYRLKEDVQPVANASDRLMQLKPCNFAWKADGSRVDGFLAHEAAEVVPEAVSGTKDAMTTEEYEVTPAVYEDVVIPAIDEVLDEDGNVITEAQEERTEQQLVSEAVMGEREVEDYQGIDQSKLVPLLTAALQEALARIEALENK